MVSTVPRSLEAMEGDGLSAPEWRRLARDHDWHIGEHAGLHDGVWHTEAAGDISFPGEAFADLFACEDESWWFTHRNRVITASIRRAGTPGAVWEIGAGNGCVSHHLQSQGIPVVAVEPIASGAVNARRRGVEAVVCGRFESLALPDASVPAVGCFDVLEHLERPQDLLDELRRTLSAGGLAVVTVPAQRWLWSDADVVSGHYRRYTRRTLGALFTAAGFEPVVSRYFMTALVPPMFCLRTLPSWFRGHRPRPNTLDRCRRQIGGTRRKTDRSPIDLVLEVELAVAGVLPIPVGTSLVGVYRKAA